MKLERIESEILKEFILKREQKKCRVQKYYVRYSAELVGKLLIV